MTSLTTPDAAEMLTVAEAAMLCGCSAPTIRRRIHEGELPAVQLGGPGKALRVRRDELEEWLVEDRRAYREPEGAHADPRDAEGEPGLRDLYELWT